MTSIGKMFFIKMKLFCVDFRLKYLSLFCDFGFYQTKAVLNYFKISCTHKPIEISFEIDKEVFFMTWV